MTQDLPPKWWLEMAAKHQKFCKDFLFLGYLCQYQPGMKLLLHKWKHFSTCQGKYARNNDVENDKVQHNNAPCPQPDDACVIGDAAHLQDEDEFTWMTTGA